MNGTNSTDKYLNEIERQTNIIKALEKLRDLFLNGETELFSYPGGRQWDFDDLENPTIKEINAVRFLKAAQVIDYCDGLRSGDDIPCEPEEKFEPDSIPFPDETRRYIQYGMRRGVRLIKFNLEQYEKLCNAYGLSPYKKEYRAHFSMGSKFVINTAFGTFTHPLGKDGLPCDIINLCSKFPNTFLNKTYLQKNIEKLKNETRSFSAILSDSKIYNINNGILAPFIVAERNRIMVKSDAVLSVAQMATIQDEFKLQK